MKDGKHDEGLRFRATRDSKRPPILRVVHIIAALLAAGRGDEDTPRTLPRRGAQGAVDDVGGSRGDHYWTNREGRVSTVLTLWPGARAVSRRKLRKNNYVAVVVCYLLRSRVTVWGGGNEQNLAHSRSGCCRLAGGKCTGGVQLRIRGQLHGLRVERQLRKRQQHPVDRRHGDRYVIANHYREGDGVATRRQPYAGAAAGGSSRRMSPPGAVWAWARRTTTPTVPTRVRTRTSRKAIRLSTRSTTTVASTWSCPISAAPGSRSSPSRWAGPSTMPISVCWPSSARVRGSEHRDVGEAFVPAGG